MQKRTPRSSPLTRLGRAIESAATVLFARSDARARASGWEVRSAGRCSTSRVYHDPRYDRLATCPSCAGHGCPRCSQTGRIARAARDWPPVPDRAVAEPAVPDWTARDWVVQDRAAREWAARTRSRSGPDDGDLCERAWSRR